MSAVSAPTVLFISRHSVHVVDLNKLVGIEFCYEPRNWWLRELREVQQR